MATNLPDSGSSELLPTWRGKSIAARRPSKAWISERIEAVLDQYRYRATLSDPAAVMARIDWFRAIGEFPQDAIDRACTEWVIDHPDDKPGPGHIRGRILASLRTPEQRRMIAEMEHRLGLTGGRYDGS